MSFNPPSVLQPRESEIGKESESKKRSALKPSLREKMFRLHNYSPFSLGLGPGSLLLLLSSSFLDFSMNPRRLAGLLLSFKELSRRYFLHFLCYSLFSGFLFYVSGSCSLLGGWKLYVSALLADFLFNFSLVLSQTMRVKRHDLIRGAGFIYDV